MQRKAEGGFSLIELLIVVVVVGVIAIVAIPALQKAVWAAQSGNTVAALRTVSSTQLSFYTQNGRFGRLNEINNLLGGAVGTQVGSEIHSNKFVFTMIPSSPTLRELQDGYRILAWRHIPGEGITYVYLLDQSGEIRQIFP